MKIISTLFVVFLLACSKGPPDKPVDWKDSLKVGMTYDEVERILGKPKIISRGVQTIADADEDRSQFLTSSTSDMSLDELRKSRKSLQRRIDELTWIRDLMLDSTIVGWKSQKKIETIGQLIYVNWVYQDTKRDSLTQFFPRWTIDTISVGRYKYYVNDDEVSEYEFGIVGDFAYYNTSGSIITKDEWEELKTMYDEHGNRIIPRFLPAKKRKVTSTKSSPRERIVTGSQKRFVTSFFSVIFDASSGRSTQWGFYPISIE